MDYGSGYNYAGGDMGYGADMQGGYYDGGNYGGVDGTSGNGGYGGMGGPSTPVKSNEPRTMVPIVVSMIRKCMREQEGAFTIFDTKISNVCIVGMVTNVTDLGNGAMEYTIHDSTGLISGKSYNNAENSNALYSRYVKVIGSLRSFSDRITLSIHAVIPIVDFNEVASHYLSTIHCYLNFKKRSSGMMQTSPIASAIPASKTETLVNGYGTEMSPVESKIYNLIRVNRDNGGEGMHINDIVQALAPQGVKEDDVRYNVEQMVQNMAIYESNPNMFSLQ